MNTTYIPFLTAVGLAASLMTVSAQSGGPFTLNWNTHDGGGGASRGGVTLVGGTKYAMTGSVGQPDAGHGVVGVNTLQGGFLPAFQKTVGPSLRVMTAGNTLTASWPNVCQGFVLEAAASPVATVWTPLGSGAVIGGNRQVAVFAPQSALFFRLRKDCPGGCPGNCPP